MLKIDLNGPLDIRLADGRAITPLPRRGQALLAYLAMQPRMAASRAAAMTLLWGDRAEDQARASLRQELSVLRRALPESVLIADRQNIALENAEVIFPSDHELLAGFDLPSSAFEEWLRQARSSAATTAPGQQRARPSVAVSPFNHQDQEISPAFVDGVVDEITGTLSRIREFHVIARQSSYALKDDHLSPVESAKKLGADYLINGSIRRIADKVRITIQLVDGVNGRLIWVEKFDDRLDDLFDLQDRIALQVAGRISPSLRNAEIRRVKSRPPSNLNAYELVLKASPHFWAHSRDNNLKAIAYIDEALGKDPEFAHALALKAWCLSQHPIYMWSDNPQADYRQALISASDAARHSGPASQHAPTLTAIGAAYSIAGADSDLALSYINRALEIDPSNAWAWLRLGWHGVYSGDVASAENAFDTSLRLSPLDPFKFNMITGRATLLMQWTTRYDEAIAMFEEGLRLNPTATWQYRDLISAYYKIGHIEKMKWAGGRLMASYPHLTIDYMRQTFAKTNVAIGDRHMARFIDAGVPVANARSAP